MADTLPPLILTIVSAASWPSIIDTMTLGKIQKIAVLKLIGTRIPHQLASQYATAIIVLAHDRKITRLSSASHIRDGRTVEDVGSGRAGASVTASDAPG